MGWSIRAFVRTDEGEFRRIPYTRFDRLWRRGGSEERFPEYAGRYLHVAIVIAETVDGKPVRIRSMECSRVKLDSEGRADQEELDRCFKLSCELYDYYMRTLEPSPDGKLLSAEHRFAKKRYDREFRWKPSRDEMKAIVGLIFR